jgi:hypothetical protein
MPKSVPQGKEQISAYVDREVMEAARNAVVATAAFPSGYRSLSALIEAAITEKVQQLTLEHNAGQPFPRRSVQLSPGRPL